MIGIYVAIPSGQAPPKLKIVKNEKVEISSMDIYGNYELICTKISEISLLNKKYQVDQKMNKNINPSWGNPTPYNFS